ncbi:O-acetyltransferase OatA [gamma proteobacterium NOR5-3]|nr:O-acetyltransferase OatA [gamma proteobacterium NOR5-3]
MQKTAKSFRHDINAYRGIAVLLVVFYHYGIPGFSFGYVGVDVFFVVSGYLMTKIIRESVQTRSFSFLEFLLRRGKRLIPALIVTVVVTFGFAYALLLPTELKTFCAHAITSIFFVSNEYYAEGIGYFDTGARTKWLLHTWSLSLEWQFYLILPLLLIAVSRLKPKQEFISFSILVVISWLICLYYFSVGSERLYFGLESRAWELMAGSLAYYIGQSSLSGRSASQRLGWVLLTFLALSLPLINIIPGWPNPVAIVPVLAVGALLATNLKSRLFENQALSALGLWSYSIYLWHWPVLVLINYVDALTVVNIFYGILLSVVLGGLSYKFVETAAANYFFAGNNITRNYLKFCVIICLTSAPIYGAFLSDGAQFRFNSASLKALAEWQNSNKELQECELESSVIRGGCLFPGVNKNISLIVYGDSHAGAIFSVLHQANHSQGSTLALVKSGCPMLTNADVKGLSSPDDCRKWNEQVIVEISNNYSGVPVVVVNRYSAYLHNQSDPNRVTVRGPLVQIDNTPSDVLTSAFVDAYMDNFFANIERLATSNPVILVQPIPEFPFNVPKMMARLLNDDYDYLPLVAITVDEYEARNKHFFNALRIRSPMRNVTSVDITEALCDERRCYGSVNGHPVYSDSDHLSESGNKLLLPVLQSSLVRF